MARRRKKNRHPLAILLLIALAIGLTWYLWPEGEQETDKPTKTTQNGGGQPETPVVPTMSKSEAQDVYKQGMAMLDAGKVIEARAELSRAYFSEALDADTEEQLRNVLTDLADETLFSGKIYKDDPYTYCYIFQPDDVLTRVIGPRGRALRVPDQLIMELNGIDEESVTRLRPDTELKFIRGPFHAIISKSDFTMDIFLQRDDLPKIYVRRLRVGLGKDDGTPVGLWRVGLGKKMTKAQWTPPGKLGDREIIYWEDNNPEYPLGKEGYWIGMEGLDKNTKPRGGYGIHGTSDPDSLGKAYSLGCIRLADEDIEFVFFTLYEFHSTIKVRP